jgi:tripartite-type tricarboxylate transporter receptor subunit TctC
MITRRTMLAGTASVTIAGISIPALADAYPSKTVRIIVPFPAGSGSDAVARFAAIGMKDGLKQTVIVDNRGGGGGLTGTLAGAQANPDGYTLTMGTTSSLITNPQLNAQAKYDINKDFRPVVGLARSFYVVMTANNDAAPKTLPELFERLKAGSANFGSSGVGTITHLASEYIIGRAGAKGNHIPYRGTPEFHGDIAAGRILFGSDTLAAALPFIRAGRVRPLAVTAPSRVASLPDVPTLKELGVSDVQISAFFGLVAPIKTPEAVVKAASAAAIAALAAPDIKPKLEALELEILAQDPKQFGELLAAETPFWVKLIKDADIKVAY